VQLEGKLGCDGKRFDRKAPRVDEGGFGGEACRRVKRAWRGGLVRVVTWSRVVDSEGYSASRCIPYTGTTVETTLNREREHVSLFILTRGILVAIGVAMPDDGSANEPFAFDWLVMSANRVDVNIRSMHKRPRLSVELSTIDVNCISYDFDN